MRHAILALIFFPTLAPAAEVKLFLPHGRSAYQTNEWIDLAVVRSAAQPLAAGKLTLSLAGADGSSASAAFAVPGGAVKATEHLHVNGRLLRPGKYTVTATADGATASTPIDVYSHVRQSSFRLLNWGRANGKDQLVQGEDSLGFNLFYAHYGADETGDNFVRAGVDAIANCVMSGGHQMDLRQECDWSDPLVSRGGTMRVVRRAMIDRTRPNVPGVHFYDEPGLTWEKHEATGETTPHMIRSQVRSYAAAFDREPLPYHQVDPKNPDHVARWRHWAMWKLGFMDAAWKESQFGVSRVRPDFLSVTQSQYGFSAYTDGYYFNVVRSLPVTSGHGGYHDYGPGFFNPSYTLEMARARDFAKPCWYLPTWYGNTTSDQFRLEQYLSFMTNIQGMMSPPDCEPATNALPRQGIVESNQLMKRLGPIFTTMPVTKPPVAMLYSLSQCLHSQTKDRKLNYLHETPQGLNLPFTYLAGKLIQQPFLTVVEEDVLDGTLAADHKAVVLTSLDYLDPKVIAALESFVKGGGLVLLTGDSTVPIKGAIKLAVTPRLPDQDKIDELVKAKKNDQLGPFQTTGKHQQGALPLAKAIQAELLKAGIKPVFECDVPTIAASRQVAGDVEYLFAVNATHDEADTKDIKNGVKAVTATIRLLEDGRPIYDALTGGVAPFKQATALRFGPGQMRVYARTSRPIGAVRVAQPTVQRDLSNETELLSMEFSAAVLDTAGAILSGSIPLHVRVVDPLGVTRHELYRATRNGTFAVKLPLAANDPAGEWKVIVRELLNDGSGTTGFRFTPPPRAPALAGATHRGVYAADDLDNCFRFARTFHDVTIVKGASAFNDAAAKRLAKILEPWGVRCKEMPLAEAAKSRKLTLEEARTWCGLAYAGTGQVKPGDGNAPTLAGFAVQGPVILLGNPDDHPILKFLLTEKFLPCKPEPGVFPGVGRGMVAWQRDGVGRGQESVALIAHDEAGMSEAVGTFFEAVAGLQPLTKWRLPDDDSLVAATKDPAPRKVLAAQWQALLPDRVEGLKVEGNGLVALAHDGTRATLAADGKVANSAVLAAAALETARKDMAAPALPPAAAKHARLDRMTKLAAANGNRLAIAYWGGTLRVGDDQGGVLAEQQLPQDATALTWLGGRLIVGLADGRVLALDVK